MKTTNATDWTSNNRSVEELHIDSVNWLSELDFIKNEIQFFTKLLVSSRFEYAIPNLFERVQSFLKELDAISKENEDYIDLLNNHENQLSGMLECEDLICDQVYLNEHDGVKGIIFKHISRFKMLKGNIFEYTDGILKVDHDK